MTKYISVSKLKKALSKDYILPLCERYIDNVPAEDVISVIHGRWISANGTYYCSNCKHYAFDSQRFDYCQDCGAKMGGNENDID